MPKTRGSPVRSHLLPFSCSAPAFASCSPPHSVIVVDGGRTQFFLHPWAEAEQSSVRSSILRDKRERGEKGSLGRRTCAPKIHNRFDPESSSVAGRLFSSAARFLPGSPLIATGVIRGRRVTSVWSSGRVSECVAILAIRGERQRRPTLTRFVPRDEHFPACTQFSWSLSLQYP